jgi:hypothetical protein
MWITARASGARMGTFIDVEKPCGIDAGIDLGRRQAGVAEQFLNGAQVAPAA